METQIHRSRKQENLQENNKNYFPFQAICALGIRLCAGEERRLGDWLLVVVGWGQWANCAKFVCLDTMVSFYVYKDEASGHFKPWR